MRKPTPAELQAYREHHMVPLASLPANIAAAFRRDHKALANGSDIAAVDEKILIKWGRSRGVLIMHEVLRVLVKLSGSADVRSDRGRANGDELNDRPV